MKRLKLSSSRFEKINRYRKRSFKEELSKCAKFNSNIEKFLPNDKEFTEQTMFDKENLNRLNNQEFNKVNSGNSIISKQNISSIIRKTETVSNYALKKVETEINNTNNFDNLNIMEDEKMQEEIGTKEFENSLLIGNNSKIRNNSFDNFQKVQISKSTKKRSLYRPKEVIVDTVEQEMVIHKFPTRTNHKLPSELNFNNSLKNCSSKTVNRIQRFPSEDFDLKLRLRNYNKIKKEQSSIFTINNMKLFAIGFAITGQVIFSEIFGVFLLNKENYFGLKIAIRVLLLFEVIVISIYIFFKLKQKQFHAEDMCVSTDKLSKMPINSVFFLLLWVLMVPIISTLANLPEELILYLIFISKNFEPFRASLTISVLSLLVKFPYLFFNLTLFWSMNVHFILVVSGLIILYVSVLKMIARLSISQTRLNNFIHLLVLFSVFVSIGIALFVKHKLSITYLDKKVYGSKWLTLLHL